MFNYWSFKYSPEHSINFISDKFTFDIQKYVQINVIFESYNFTMKNMNS